MRAKLFQASHRELEKTQQLRVASGEVRRLETVAQKRAQELEHLVNENGRLTNELEEISKKHSGDLAESLAENQRLKLELDSSKLYGSRLSSELGLLKEAEWRRVEALKRSRDEVEALSSQVEELTRQADMAQVRH